jgi:T4 beta protein
MKFGAAHYVPVLKIKDNEKRALGSLGAAYQGGFTPLLEVVERKDKPLAAHVDTTFKRLAQSLTGNTPCFLDARELAPDGDAGAQAVFTRADSEGIDYVPVVGLTRLVGNGPAFAHGKGGVALRLTRDELEAGIIAARVTAFLKAHHLGAENIDLVMDMGDVGMLIPVGVVALANSFLSAVPHHTAWRTFTMSGCAFPKSLGKVARNSFLLVNRSEWIGWRDGLYANRGNLTRLPTYSDCAIQHPSGVEGYDPITMAASAAARHASRDSWLLVKGVSTRVIPPTVQFKAIAKRLVANVHGPHYPGATHCVGCAQIAAAAKGAPKLGSLGVWRRIGTEHHVVTVLRDLGALHWP